MEVFIEISEMTHPCNDFIFKRMQIRHLVNRWKNGMQLFGYNERVWAQHKPKHQIWSMVLFSVCWNNGIRLAYSSPLERVFVCSGGWWVFKWWWIQRGWQKWELLPSFNYCVKLNYIRNQKTWTLHQGFI